MRFVPLLIGGLLLTLSCVALAQDDTDLIDDLPQERKEAAKAAGRRTKKKAHQPTLQPQPNTDLIDDLSPQMKQAAARKAESAIPENLADALARALHNSPAISVAQAKVRQAQAELNEVRLNVVQELTLAFQRRASNKADLAAHEAAIQTGTAPSSAGKELRQEILEDETKILYLLGVGADHSEGVEGSADARSSSAGAMGMMMGGMGMGGMGMGGMGMGGMGMGGMGMGGMGMGGMGMGGMPMMGGGMGQGGMMGSGGMMAPSGMMGGGMGGGGMAPGGSAATMMRMMGGGGAIPATTDAKSESSPPDKLKKSLESVVDLDFDRQPLSDVLDYLSQASGVTFVRKEKELSIPVTASLRQVPLEAALQALADLTDYCFVFRDYGVLVIQRDEAPAYVSSQTRWIGRGAPTAVQ